MFTISEIRMLLNNRDVSQLLATRQQFNITAIVHLRDLGRGRSRRSPSRQVACTVPNSCLRHFPKCILGLGNEIKNYCVHKKAIEQQIINFIFEMQIFIAEGMTIPYFLAKRLSRPLRDLKRMMPIKSESYFSLFLRYVQKDCASHDKRGTVKNGQNPWKGKKKFQGNETLVELRHLPCRTTIKFNW